MRTASAVKPDVGLLISKRVLRAAIIAAVVINDGLSASFSSSFAFLDSILGAAGCPAAQSFHKAHQATGRSFFGYVMDATPTLVGPPVHALWLVGKLLKHVWAAAQPHSVFCDFPSPR
jgi:hypothetical protein